MTPSNVQPSNHHDPHDHDDPNAHPRPLLTVSQASKRFGNVIALDDVSLQIRPNEFFALLGPSGCGKTTLLRAIAGFEDLDSGTIRLNGSTGEALDLLALPPNKRPVNLMFQSYALFPHMSVRRNIAYGLEREHMPRSQVQERVEAVLQTVGLQDKANVRPGQLSGGQRQRVALARAMVKQPRMLLLDEPLSALDRKVRAEMQVELKRLQHEVGITFVVVTHDQEEAMSMADRIAVMQAGTIQQIAEPVEMYRQPANAFVADFIGSGTFIRGTATPAGLVALGTTLPSPAAASVRGPALLVLRPEDVHVLPSPADGLLTGTVIESHFFGGSTTTAIAIAGIDAPVLSSRSGTPTHRPGDAVGISWRAADAIVLPDAN